ncbi:hypothetical protein KKC65_02875 [Patescibacteria group bacterium]|nr:hypothetical protein [Patescibacteria group bacterium]
MKIIIFDVSNSACNLAMCPNGNSLMIDCGSHNEKDCPVDIIKQMRTGNGWLSGMKDYITTAGLSYPLTTLSISHPDSDHINNCEKIKGELTPYLLSRRYLEDFPEGVIDCSIDSLKKYKEQLCDKYRSNNIEEPNWGFTETVFSIPMDILRDESFFETFRIKNNSSYVHLLNYKNKFRIIFGGDMEEVGWNWLLDNNHNNFKDIISDGIDVMVASHHGHTSGYSQKLFDSMGAPKLSILSKGSEENKEGTDVTSSYSQKSTGLMVRSIATKKDERKYSLTTRRNGNIYIDVDSLGNSTIHSDK